MRVGQIIFQPCSGLSNISLQQSCQFSHRRLNTVVTSTSTSTTPASSDPNWSASASWDTHYKKYISTLERVQRKAARFCLQNFNKTASVTDMLSDLKWDTLEIRRKRNRLTLMYKLNRNLVDITTEEHLILNSEKRTRNSHAFKYRMPKVSMESTFLSFLFS